MTTNSFTQARDFLLRNPDIANEIEQKILTKLGVGAKKQAAAAPAATAAAAPVESLPARMPARKVGA